MSKTRTGTPPGLPSNEKGANFISGLGPEDSSWLWPCCQDCGSRKACPYAYDQLVHHIARQGQTEAQRLTAEADRFLETLSYSNDIRRILEGSRDLEQALSRGLSAETAQMDRLCAQTAQSCP